MDPSRPLGSTNERYAAGVSKRPAKVTSVRAPRTREPGVEQLAREHHRELAEQPTDSMLDDIRVAQKHEWRELEDLLQLGAEPFGRTACRKHVRRHARGDAYSGHLPLKRLWAIVRMIPVLVERTAIYGKL